MHSVKTLVTLFAGAAFGIALVMSCSDDAPSKVDAADPVCDCPAAEPPLAGRFYTVEFTGTLAANAPRGVASVACRSGDQLVSGSCVETTGTILDIDLVESHGAGNAWGCTYQNNTATAVDIKVIAHCLDVTP